MQLCKMRSKYSYSFKDFSYYRFSRFPGFSRPGNRPNFPFPDGKLKNREMCNSIQYVQCLTSVRPPLRPAPRMISWYPDSWLPYVRSSAASSVLFIKVGTLWDSIVFEEALQELPPMLRNQRSLSALCVLCVCFRLNVWQNRREGSW